MGADDNLQCEICGSRMVEQNVRSDAPTAALLVTVPTLRQSPAPLLMQWNEATSLDSPASADA